jgi:hypothetical protein
MKCRRGTLFRCHLVDLKTNAIRELDKLSVAYSLRCVSRWLVMAGLFMPGAGLWAARAAGTAAVRADDFLNSIGACSAVSRRGENLPNTIEAVKHLGLRWIRTGYESGIPVADLLELHRQTGIEFSYGLMSGGTNLTRLLEGARQLASAGALFALEGNNEPNNWGVRYEGERGGRTNSWLPVARLQRDLYRAVKSDPVLSAGLPLLERLR